MYVCGGRGGKYCAFLGNAVAFMGECYLNLKKAKIRFYGTHFADTGNETSFT